jgi:hypothetical protein
MDIGGVRLRFFAHKKHVTLKEYFHANSTKTLYSYRLGFRGFGGCATGATLPPSKPEVRLLAPKIAAAPSRQPIKT